METVLPRTALSVTRCRLSGRPFIISFREKGNGIWMVSTGPKLSEDRVSKDQSLEIKIEGIKRLVNQGYHCPFCDANNIIQCPKCQKHTCWDNKAAPTCSWCGDSGGKVSEHVTTVDAAVDV
jgi:transcription elongation factor Elf1